MSPFRNILKLSIGDFVAKVAYFLAFVYMAKALGVRSFGVLELAIAVRTYVLLFADAGLELCAIRETAHGGSSSSLIPRVLPARLALAAIAVGVTAILSPISGDPDFRRVLPLLSLSVLAQAFSLKWLFMGRQQMTRVAVGLIASQLVFAACAVALVRHPSDVILAPVAFLLAEAFLAAYFWTLFVRADGRTRLLPDWSGLRAMAPASLTLGASQCLALMSYNVDSILIGLLLGPGPVGLYAAAYKPITAVLAAPVTYFQGLFPELSRSYHDDRARFRAVLLRSLRLTTMFAAPIGVGGTFLAHPLILFLFGPGYAESAPALQLLSWSAVLVILRGNFRHTLNAVGKQRLDFICAAGAAAANVVLNLVLIPRYGITGAATATVASEVGWFLLARYLFSRHVIKLPVLSAMWRPMAAGLGMAVYLALDTATPWMLRAAASLTIYALILIITGEPELRNAIARCAPLAWAGIGVKSDEKTASGNC